MKLFFYCQHSIGMGHFVRSSAMAERLSHAFDIVFLNGGPVPAGLPFPDAVERIDLPPLGMREDATLVSLTPGLTVDEALQRRRDQMIALLNARQPDVVLIELFPFGRRKFECELIPLLTAAHARGADRPLIVCSLRDLLVTARRSQQEFDDRARDLCHRFFDLVMAHTDPIFARLEDTFRPSVPLATPVEYTGFLTRDFVEQPSVDRSGVLVSAGGGHVGEPLFRAAVAAHAINWPVLQLPTTIVAGPFAPPAVVADLQTAATKGRGLTVLPQVPSLVPLLTSARASVSQCGYNTALDLLRARVPALVVPFAEGRENEQTTRATRLAECGLLETLPSTELTPERLAGAIRELLDFTPARPTLDMNGAETTLRLLSDLASRRSARSQRAFAGEAVR
ncbi:MAG: glycosyltransferase [Vicinamibacterales bacterium]